MKKALFVISDKCKVQKCTLGKSFLDPCDETHYYVCDYTKIWRKLCPNGTHFTRMNEGSYVCSHIYEFISWKTKFWKACGIKKNFSIEECRQIWPENAEHWNKVKINDFFKTRPQKLNFLVPSISVIFFLLCLLAVIIFLLKRKKNCKPTNSIVNKNDQQTEEKEEENKEPIYEEIDENPVTPFPALMTDQPEINQTQNLPNQQTLYEMVHFTQDSCIDINSEEGEYKVLDIQFTKI